jgi:hypothetical protein
MVMIATPFMRPEQHRVKVQAAEKYPAGAKARIDFKRLTARLKSCPDTKQPPETPFTSFSAACKAPLIFGTYGTTEVVLFQNTT